MVKEAKEALEEDRRDVAISRPATGNGNLSDKDYIPTVSTYCITITQHFHLDSCTVHLESIQTLDFFHILLHYSLILKCIEMLFF